MHPKKQQKGWFSAGLFKFSPSSHPGALDLASLTCLLSEKAKEFLVENKVQTFYQQELEMVESLLSIANQPMIHSTCSELVSVTCSHENSSLLS